MQALIIGALALLGGGAHMDLKVASSGELQAAILQ